MRKKCGYCGISYNVVLNLCPQCGNLWTGETIGDNFSTNADKKKGFSRQSAP